MTAPNILLIQVDQLAANALSAYGNQTVKDPNLASLAKDGELFSKTVTATCQCAARLGLRCTQAAYLSLLACMTMPMNFTRIYRRFATTFAGWDIAASCPAKCTLLVLIKCTAMKNAIPRKSTRPTSLGLWIGQRGANTALPI